MPAPANWQFAVEVHPPDWRFPAGQSWLAGWIYAGEHRFITDLRAWIDGRPFLGLPGIPKPGLDERFLGRAGPPYSGFVLRVEPHRGARRLRLEARDPSGNWTEFFAADITVDEAAPVGVPPAALDSRLPELIPELLRLRVQRATAPWAALADEVISAALAEPLNALPVPPFHGALEGPKGTGLLGYGRLAVHGWLAHRTAKITRITALVDAVQEAVLLHGLPRTDGDTLFADLPGRDRSQFSGHVDLPANQSSPALLKVFAELDNGEKHLVFAQRFIPRFIAGAEVSLPSLSRLTFARAWWALHGAARRHHIPGGERAALIAATKAAWSQYRAEAPARRRQHPVLTLPTTPVTDNRPLRVLVATHNLNLEGAPWFIFELARHLAERPGAMVTVISPQDGPLRRIFTDAGMAVQVLELATTLSAPDPDAFSEQLRAATREINWPEVDLVIANTMVSFWAVHAARLADRPALLYVHESTAIRRFFAPILPAALFPVVEEAFRLARRVVFTADASRQVFDYLNTRGNFALLPSWVDVDRIDAFAAAHDKAALRRKHGLDPDAVLVVNIASVCERKGQHIFIRAIELLKEELRLTYPGRKIHFLMVGARPGYYLESLKQELRLHGLAQTFFVAESSEIFDFYRLADILVCTSFEESFPRVLLESAVFQLPIITTNVNGIVEMLAPDEAWITPPGDRYQLGDAIKQAIAAHLAGDTQRAGKARASVVRRYHQAASLPLHAALAQEAARPCG